MAKITPEEIRKFFLFQLLNNEELGSVAELLKERDFQPGSIIFSQGEEGNTMFIVKSGVIKITMKLQDGEKEIVTLGPDGFFGEIALFERVPRTATATAVQDSIIYEIDRDNFAEVISQNPYIGNKIFYKIIQDMGKRLRRMNLQV
jgi:CRP/FNR family transcriptional regulator